VIFNALRPWGIVALLWVGKELLSHGATLEMSLSEQSMLVNVSTVLIMALESSHLLPAEARLQVSAAAQVAIGGVVFGSVLFAINWQGIQRNFHATIAMAIGIVIVTVPGNIWMRWLLVRYSFLTICALTLIDMIFLMPVASAVSWTQEMVVFANANWGNWLSDPTILVLLVLSCISFTAAHAVDMQMMRRCSGTACVVAQGVGNSALLILGSVFFNDMSEAKNSFALVGVAVVFLAGVWLSSEMLKTNPSTKSPEAA